MGPSLLRVTLTCALILAGNSLFGAEIRHHDGMIFGVAYSSDGRSLYSAADDGFLRAWSTADRRLVRQWKAHDGGVLAMALSADGKTLVTGGRDSKVRVWDPLQGKQRRTLDGLFGDVESVAISPDGRWLAASSSGRIKQFRLANDGVIFT